jgi:tetratricopeptide (TPR) repeat protein
MDRTGQLLAGRYRFLRQLGSGGMGTVYLAEHVHLNRLTAVKLLRAELCTDPNAEVRFRREALLAARVSHPAVAQIYDFERTAEGDFLIAMEYVEGETLAHRLQRSGPLAIPHAVAILAGVADGLDTAHALGILHRDLKPQNLMLTADARVKLLDFGIAHALDVSSGSITEEGMVVGTPLYMSPEQLLGEPLTPASDIYSLGVVMFEMLTGQAVNAGTSFAELRAQRVVQPPPRAHVIRRECPPALSEVVAHALDPNPTARWATATQFAEAAAAAGDPSSVVVQARRRGETASASAQHDRWAGHFAALRFAGREREVQLVRDAWSAARSGRTTVLWIEGDEGAGKSCFFALAQREAVPGGAATLLGRGFQADIVRPYGAWISILRSALESWGRAMRPWPATEALTDARQDTVSDRGALHDEVGALLRAGSATSPLFIGIEDLDWCDPTSLSLLEFLVHDVVDAPVLLAVTAVSNSAAGDPSLHRLRERLRRLERVIPVALRPLSREAIASWLARALGREPPDELVRYVYGHTEGNAFFIEQVVRSLLERGTFEQLGDETARLAIANDPPPEAIADVVRRRLRAMSAATREVLQVAAIVGREFDVDLLLPLSGRDEDYILDALDEAVAAGVLTALRRAGGDWYRFTNNEVAKVLEQGVNARRRRRLHGQIATALDGRPQTPAGMQAWHWYHAGDVTRAFEAARRATSGALALHNDEDALIFGAIVVETARSTAERREAQELRGDTLRHLGRFTEAAAAYAHARSTGDSDDSSTELRRKELRCVLRSGTMSAAAVAAEARKLVEEARSLPPGQQAAAELLLAEALTEAGDCGAASEAARRAQTAALLADDQTQAADALLALGTATLKGGDAQAADSAAREASAIAAVVGDRHSGARSAMLRGSAAAARGDVTAARAAFGEALRQAEGANVTRLAREIREEISGLGA